MRSLWLASLFAALWVAGPATAATLHDLQWQYRVIAVFTPDVARANAARHTLAHTAGIADRDIAWFVVTPTGVQTNIETKINRKNLNTLHKGHGFEAVLVGKDGGVKARQHDALDLLALFDLIDAMPMRQREMHRR